MTQNERHVKGQAELDQAIADGVDVIVITDDGLYVVTGNVSPMIRVACSSQPIMLAYGDSRPTMEAYDDSRPIMLAYDDSRPTMEACGDSRPTMPLLDMWLVLDQLPGEVAGLRAALVDGRVDGSTYSGECACLLGTAANVRGCSVEDLAVRKDSSRPIERWFTSIQPGDAPVPIEELTGDTPVGVFRASYALAWLDAWVLDRTRIAMALLGQS